MERCSFCNLDGSKIFYEDSYFVAVLDKRPISKGHSLLIPRKHVKDIFDCDEKTLIALGGALRTVSELLKERLGCAGVNILHASGRAAQQSVFHLHFHIIPRYEGDGLDAWPKSDYEQKEDILGSLL